jgi:hypothetical protein
MKSGFILLGACMSCLISMGAQPEPTTVSAAVSATNTSTTNGQVLNRTSFLLKPTAIAPAGAAGSAEVKPGGISLHLSQLGPGRYDLEGVTHLDGTNERLGTITIVDPTLSPDRQANDNKKEASANPDQVRVETNVEIAVPEKLSAPGFDQILLLNSGGNALLASDPRK